jgi:hypothetical protein
LASDKLGEVGELLDRRFVRGGELVDLDHCGGPLGSWVEAAFAALHKPHSTESPLYVKGFGQLFCCAAACR